MKHVFLFLFTLSLLSSVFLFSEYAKSDAPTIVITEIGAYEPNGSGNEHEWIEIFNIGNEAINLEGWKFSESGSDNHGLTLKQGDDSILDPGEYAIITQNDILFLQSYPEVFVMILDSSWSTLNESGEEIGLKDASGDFVEQFTYVSAPNFSLERIDPLSQDYTTANWREHPDGNTVGTQNYWHVGTVHEEETNKPPTAMFSVSTSTTQVGIQISFDASGSTDDIGIETYAWNFGDETNATDVTATHSYTAIGDYNVILTVTDTQGEPATATHVIHIIEQAETPPDPTSTTDDIHINEFVSNPNTDEQEWIELYNASTSSVLLTGWTLHDGAGQIAAPTSTITAGGYIIIELSSSKLNNGGDIIVLKNTENVDVDIISYGDWENATGVAPAKGNTLAKNETHEWKETTTPTKGATNTITPPATQPPPSSGGGGGGSASPPPQMFEASVIVINEIVSDPQDTEGEFVELYNTSDTSLSLEHWWIEDGSEMKTMLEGTIASKQYIVIDAPKGNLNNSGDIVMLFDPSGKNIDSVTYGTWDDGDTSDNAPAPPDPLSIARRLDGLDANNDFYDFVLTDTITKGKANVISLTTNDGTGQVLGTKIFTSEIHITEVYPNPPGSDSDDEFIELYNTSDKTMDITGWKLGDSSKKRYTIAEGHMAPGAYMVIKRAVTGIALNNSGGEDVGLYDPNGAIVEKAHYEGSVPEGQSWSKKEDGSWAWTTEVTPSEMNVIEGKSAAPIIAIAVDTEVAIDEQVVFDASDTTDPEAENMTFVWTFGDNSTDEGDVITHAFGEEGTYTVTLAVTDASGNTSSKNVIVMVKNRLSFVGGFNAETPIEKIQISEILPNPEGSDTTEFIELYNPTEEKIDLTDMKLDDEEGGSRAYTIPKGTVIESKQYLVFGRQDTKLALNNTTDSARILYPDGTVLRDIRYDDVLEGHSYVRDQNDEWIWTSSLTPGTATILSPPDEGKASKTTTKSKMVKPVIKTTLAMLRSEDIGDTVTLSGTVAVLPGVFGTQYFYIVDPIAGDDIVTSTEQTDKSQDILAGNATPGAQVYMFSKDFPKMEIGDVIQVTGEISESGGETRIKLKEKTDITVLEHSALPTGVATDIADLGEEREGWLVELHGEITELKSSYMYLDDGTDEVKVYFQKGTGITPKIYQLGDLARVTGIVGQTKTGYRVLPRSPHDIIKTGVVEDVIIEREAAEEESNKEIAEKYLTATAGGLTAILVGLVAKMENSPFKKIMLFFKRKTNKE